MSIIFTADWHIKLGQKNVPVEWARRRYTNLFYQLGQAVEKYNVTELVIGGDIFDRLPTLEEQSVYYEFLLKFRTLNVDIVIYSGNHEALKKNTTFLSYLKDVTVAANPRAKIVDDWYATDKYDIIPYNRLKEFAEKPRNAVNKILFTHVRGEIPPHVHPEVDLAIFEPWETVYAGDLHSHSNCQRNIVYPGSPVTTSFHRSEVTTGVVLIKPDGAWDFINLTLPQLIRKTVSSVDDMIKTDYHHTIYELEGDMQELAKIDNPELLDKKLVAKDSVSSLGLRPEMSITDELEEYLKKVLLIPEDKAKTFTKKFNDYIQNPQVG